MNIYFLKNYECFDIGWAPDAGNPLKIVENTETDLLAKSGCQNQFSKVGADVPMPDPMPALCRMHNFFANPFPIRFPSSCGGLELTCL